jgi:hypothetical protein
MTTGCLILQSPTNEPLRDKIHFIFEQKYLASIIYSSLPSTQIEYYSDNIYNVSVDIHPVSIVAPERLLEHNSEK